VTDIVTVTLNPAVDVATSFEQVTDTRKLRCSAARRDPGGDGINVARVAQRPGGDCVALYLCGGATGQMLQQLLDTERVAGLRIEIAGETRENFSVQETSTGREYRFVLPGPTVARHEWQRYIDHVGALEVQPRVPRDERQLAPWRASRYLCAARTHGSRTWHACRTGHVGLGACRSTRGRRLACQAQPE
jgi:6-phosphofructokinase 2